MGLDVAPVAPLAMACSSSATAQESFQISVGVVETARRSRPGVVSVVVTAAAYASPSAEPCWYGAPGIIR